MQTPTRAAAMPEEPTSTATLVASLAPEALGCPGEYTPGLLRYSVSPLLGPDADVVAPIVEGDVPVVVPPATRRANVQGVVVVRTVVADSGCVSSVDVHRSIPLLHVPAVAVALKWSFLPPSNGGVPTSTAIRRFINFKF